MRGSMDRLPEYIRVVLADDHTIVRQGLCALLSTEPDIRVIGEASDGREVVALCARLNPDVVVMDAGMPELNGIDATRQVCKQSPSTRVVILSMYGCEEYVRPAIRAGASGYLLKGSGLDDLVAAIRAVAAGEVFFSLPIQKILLRDALTDGPAGSAPAIAAELSGREREILQLVGEGKTSPAIAKLLHLSVKTVEGHRSRIMAKLDVHDVAGLVRCAVRLGLVSIDAP
jgi:two-component system, NarL family, response regulator NreC